MQRSLRFNENQYIYLANKAKNDFALSAYLWKKSRESLRWQQKYFVLYQNFLFYYENDSSVKPMGCYLLEGSYCEHVIPSAKMNPDRQFMLAISFRGEGGRQIELACDNQEQCDMWVAAIQKSSFNLVRMHKEELEKKHQHLLQILDTERGAKNQYMIQVEEQADEIAKLRAELLLVKQQLQKMKVNLSKSGILTEEETEELRKIKKQLSAKSLAKVQSLMRGWLCRRRWMSIVNEYIKSPHAEMMRVRNRLVFAMVADEEDYVAKLSVLVSVFYRTLKMAASSKKPLISHEDVNSIFLNCETILFLHQIFSKGLNARLEAWPRLILGDLFDMLLPMLSIYQEYVRNHHYSLQVLAECKQKSGDFGLFIQRYEEKPICEGRTIEHYLTVPMWQIPRYIQSLCQILAHTPHDHVERKSLEYAKHQLETLSTNMRDEVSETENIRRNLAIERQIVEGCDILLDVQQIFIRQGTMLQACLESKPIVAASASKSQISETGSGGSSSNNSSGSHYHLQHSSNSSLSASAVSGTNTSASSALSKKRSSPAIILGGGGTSNVSGGGSGSGGGSAAMTSYFSGMDKKEAVKQCFLFSNHLIITSRSSSGKLHLNKLLGKIPLVNATLLDDDLFSIPVPTSVMPNSTALSSSSSSATITSASSSFSSSSPLSPVKESPNAEFEGRYFKLVVSHQQVSYLFIFVAPTNQEKEAWVTDIGQCIENIHISGLLTGQVRFEESSSIRMLQSVRSDPSLFQDDPHIKFSRGTNSCRVPQIRYATVEKLLDRLVDVRFLSIEFLNTFLMTYRYFTTAQRVMQVLRQALLDPQSTPNSAGGEGFTIGSPNGSSNSYSTLSDASEHQMSPGAGPQGNHLSTNTNPMSPHLQTGNQSVTQKGPYINGAAATAVPSTPSPVEQMVGNPSTYRLRKNTAPSVVNSINNQSVPQSILSRADAIKRRMAQAPRNRIFSDAAVPIGQCKPPMTSQNSQQNESNASKRLSGDQGSILGFGRKSEPNNNGMNSSNEVEPLVLSEHVGESSPSSPEAVTTMSESSVSTSTINSAVSATTSNLRASLNSIGEFVSARKQQLTSKQLSVDSDDSSFVVYSIKDSDTESLRNERRFSMESVEETEKNIIERVKEVALKISESSFNNSNNNHSNNNHNINNNNNHTGGINSHNHSSSSDQFEKSLSHGRNHSSMMQLHPSSGLGSAFGDQVPAKRFSLDSYLHSRNEATNSTSNKKIHHAPGVVVTSSRKSTRRSSLQTAAAAFAAATAGANTLTNSSSLSGIGGGPTTKSSSQSGSGGGTSGGSGASNANSTSAAYSSTLPSRSLANRRNNHMSSPSSSAVSSVSNNLFSKNTKGRKRYCSRHKIEHGGKRSSDFSSATSMRVLHVLRHWSTKFPEDFEEGEPANQLLISMLKEAQSNECLTAEEEKIVNGIYRTLCKLNHERALTNFEESKDDFVALLADLKHETNPTGDFSYPQVPPVTSSIVANGLVSLEGMSALELAENLTFIEHKVFSAIPFWEFFNQAWVKEDKQEKAPKILLTTKRFNDVSTLVATTILRESTEKGRAAVIEKWAGVADVCKGLKNFNSVLEIISAFGRTPVYRLRKTWERISKQTRSTIDKLQILVSTDGHFKNLRDALHKCDPPALPYLGMYLTDLTFIEDGTPMVTSDALINFSRMRMVSNVVQEIRLYQQTPYQTEIKADTLKWLLQSGHVWTEEQMYNRSLQLEPRPSSGNSQNQQTQQQQTHHGSRSHQL
ncbi:ras-specific guanine nucleotide-releasing factor 2-like isoform X8 [Convolutriloba macropyga]|uniref:ras-specific guanine nucleotide-releasing factor 2-like isoform X8 n=1 Tax=Convolutriloba macropyga TaxID=536237 RepID=UPI003F51E631